MGSHSKTRTTESTKMLCSVSTMLLTLTLAKLSTSSDTGLVSHPNGAIVPEYTPEVAAARLQHLQALQAEVREDKRGRGLDLALLLGLGLNALAGPRSGPGAGYSRGGGGAGYSRGGCDTTYCQLCTEYGACRKNCGPVCRRKCC